MQRNNNPHLFRVPKVVTVIGRMDFVLDRCRGRKVLHLGCVDEGLTEERIKSGNLLHIRLMDAAKDVWGVDISVDGIELLRKSGIDNLFVGDIEYIEQIKELKQQTFDIILATEVLEHLNNPGLFLTKCKQLFSPNTVMIITVPNGLRLTGLGYTLKGYEFVHPDHNYWFSYKTLDMLLGKNGYQIEQMLVYSFFDYIAPLSRKISEKIREIFRVSKTQVAVEIADTKLSRKKHGLPFTRRNILETASFSVKWMLEFLIRRYLYHRNPFFVSDGIIVVVKPVMVPKKPFEACVSGQEKDV